jgi:hypothetical protein
MEMKTRLVPPDRYAGMKNFLVYSFGKSYGQLAQKIGL